MRFSEIYQAVIAHWPPEVRISDGYPTGGSGFFPSLSDEAFRIKELIGFEEPWTHMMEWTIFQELHSEAQRELGTKSTIRPADADKAAIERRYFANLHAEDWSDLLPEYVRDADEA